MKIEVGESLVLSWLRHVKKCQIVQLNWKPSVTRWALHNRPALDEIMEGTRSRYSNQFGLEIFGRKVALAQLLQQGEIDAIGIQLQEDGRWRLHAVDVAFHGAGLGYGSSEE